MFPEKMKMWDIHLYMWSNLCVVRKEIRKLFMLVPRYLENGKKWFLAFLLLFFSVFHLLQTMNSTVVKHAGYGARPPTDLSLNLSESQCSHPSCGSNNHFWLVGWL